MTDVSVLKSAFFEQIGYKPHEMQWLYHNSKARFKLPNCGRRFGKSTMAARDMEPELFLPDRLYWIVGPTYDLGEKEFRYIWQDLIVKQKLGKDKRIKRSYNKKQGNMFLEFPWGTRVEVRSADHPEHLVGDALHGVIMSEAAKHKKDTWERFIRPQLADYRGWASFPTTPEGYNWIYDLWMFGQDANVPEYESWRFPSWANDQIYPGGFNDPEIQLLKRTMSPEAFEQEIGADFGSFVGKIYPEWDIAQHVTNVNFNPMWPNYIAFDWGYTNPLAAVEFQVSPSDEVFVWREHYKSYMRVEEHCKVLRQREQPDGYHLDLAFGDAADPEAAEVVSNNLVPCIADPDAKSNWREGIDLVRSFMERENGEDEFGGPTYAPAFHVDFSCVNTIREFNNYKAPDSVAGKNVQEIGLRQDDHTLDALRYGLVHIFKLGATHHLSEVIEMTVPDRGHFSGSDFDVPAGDGGFFTTAGGF
jgi:hypothetical protein